VSTWLSLSFRSLDISLRDMQLESASEEIAGSDGSEGCGHDRPTWLFRGEGSGQCRPLHCRLRSAACSAMISATSADRGTVPLLGLGRLVAGL
jgi:hypothetical protein